MAHESESNLILEALLGEDRTEQAKSSQSTLNPELPAENGRRRRNVRKQQERRLRRREKRALQTLWMKGE